MKGWAEREVELACKHENPNWDGESFDYGCMCYQSALKAYKSLADDGHSGFSWSVTANILNRLTHDLPLTPITDEDFKEEDQAALESPEYLKEHGLKSELQCSRMYSLFRKEKLDGTVTYRDVERSYCVNENDENDTFSNGLLERIVDELFPITMPYYPKIGKYEVHFEQHTYDKGLGENDLRKILYVVTPEKAIVTVNKCYKEVVDEWYRYSDSEFIHCSSHYEEISNEEYEKLKVSEQIETEPTNVKIRPAIETCAEIEGLERHNDKKED